MMAKDRLEVHVKRSLDRGWTVEFSGMWLHCDCPSQRAAVHAARFAVGAHVSAGGRVQIIVHAASGRIQRDITLPRGRDPRRSRG
jgi:hypothetical protein